MSSKEKSFIPPHTHCRVCGKSIPLGKELCSNECREKESKAQRKSKRTGRLYLVFLVILIVAMLIFTFAGQR
ncbi:MAG: DUF2116 family Zn-ribbon domain-containing protein [Nitrososphaerales archaeon]